MKSAAASKAEIGERLSEKELCPDELLAGQEWSPLTTAEIDKNFSNLPTDKLISSVRSIMFDA